MDVIGLAVDGDCAAVQVFPLRDGRLIDRYAFHLENVGGQDRATILEGFCLEYYTRGARGAAGGGRAARHRGHRGAGRLPVRGARRGASSVRAPKRGEKRRLAELAAENARVALEHEATAAEQKRQRRIEALEHLREALNLECLPARIECFDVSNIQGREIVASMAVFVDGAAASGALPHVRHARARRAGRLRRDRGGGVPALRAAARRDGDPKRRDESFASGRTSS